MGIGVPDQISIVGFDNLELAAHLDPPLTTMEVPAAEMGEHAAELLLRRANGQSALPSIHLEPRLIVRRTAGRAHAQHPSPFGRLDRT